MLETLTIDDFKPHVGSSFRMDQPPGELRLERAAPVMESEHARLKRHPFSLYFRGPLDPPSFPEPLPIFLVPVGRTSEGIQYEAVFT